jgi:hypothetical protein
VQLGNFRLKLPLKRLELRQKAVKEQPASRTGVQGGAGGVGASPGWSLTCAANGWRPGWSGWNAI